MPISLVMVKPHQYDGRVIRKGERFMAHSEVDATVLTLGGWARYDTSVSETKAQPVEPIPEPPPAVVQEPEPEPQPEPISTPESDQAPTDVPADPSDPPKRRYRRKDMAAEG